MRSRASTPPTVSPSKPPRTPTASPGKGPAGRSAAKPSSAASPPWATHGDLDVPLKPSQRKRASAHAVQFRGTESLVSLHRIDQDMAADARLSQRLGNTTLTAGRLSRLAGREDEAPDRLNSSMMGSSLTSTQAGAILRAASLGRTEVPKPRSTADDAGRNAPSASSRPRSGSATVSSTAPSRASPTGVLSPGPRPAAGASPPWLAIPHSSRRPSREPVHGHRSYAEPAGASPSRRGTGQ